MKDTKLRYITSLVRVSTKIKIVRYPTTFKTNIIHIVFFNIYGPTSISTPIIILGPWFGMMF